MCFNTTFVTVLCKVGERTAMGQISFNTTFVTVLLDIRPL